MKKRKMKAGRVLFVLAAVAWLLVTLFPLYFTLVSSFKEDSEIWKSMFALPEKIRVENYIQANKAANIIRATFNSIVLSIGSILIMLVCVIPAAYVLARKKIKGAAILGTYFMAALMIPIHGALVSIIQMANIAGGQNNYLFLMIIYSGLNFSMACFILTGYIKEIDRGLDEAAYMDGCSPFQVVWKIILPVSKPAIATVAIVSFLSIYNELPISNVLLTKKTSQTISVALLAFKGDYQVNTSWIFASVILSMIPLVLFYLICQESVEKGLTAGAMKG